MQAVQVSEVSVERSSRLMMVAAGAALIGAASFALNIGDGLSGEIPALGRALLGLVGLAGGALLWLRPRLGWNVALLWAIFQIPFIAWNTDGSVTSQLIDFPLSMSSSTTVNGVVTSYSEFGINLIGVALVIVISRMRGSWMLRNR
ncbi:MAG TPA: hypothetical protein VFV93_00910 [Thermomicrobiales bacterium]|nr:hypothetical protein [Thermomicrobiales bacterium]